MTLVLDPQRRPRRPSLTPLVDVVFLLLVFFMLAARFGAEAGLPVTSGAGGGTAWQGPPRLVEAAPDGPRLNGAPVVLAGLPAALAPLMPQDDSRVVVRPMDGADAGDLAAVLGALADAGIAGIVVD